MVVRRVIGVVVSLVVVATGVFVWTGAASSEPDTVGIRHHTSEKLGPVGYRKLRLGMTRAQVRHTHEAVIGQQSDTCAVIKLRAHWPGRHSASGYLSTHRGLVAIFATGPMHTPAGIRLGSTRAQVRAAYPTMRDGADGSTVQIKGNPGAQYMFLFKGTGPQAPVYGLGLVSNRQDCFN